MKKNDEIREQQNDLLEGMDEKEQTTATAGSEIQENDAPRTVASDETEKEKANAQVAKKTKHRKKIIRLWICFALLVFVVCGWSIHKFFANIEEINSYDESYPVEIVDFVEDVDVYEDEADYVYKAENAMPTLRYKKRHGNIINPSTDEVIVKDVDWFANEEGRDTLILFYKNGKFGFCNIITKKIVVKPEKYTAAWRFSEGKAAVEQNGKIGFVNADGKVVIDFKFHYHSKESYDYSERYSEEFVFHYGHCIVADQNDKVGIINTKGEWIVEPIYDKIILNKDYAIVYTDGDFKKQIDYQGNVLQDGIIDEIGSIGIARGCEFEHAYADAYGGSFCTYWVGHYVGLMNDKGEFITPPIYTEISAVSQTVFNARLKDTQSEILINQKGEVIYNLNRK